MGRPIAIAASLAGLGLVLFAGAPAQADEYGSRARRHHVVRHYAGCERVVVRETGYRYYPRAQLYSLGTGRVYARVLRTRRRHEVTIGEPVLAAVTGCFISCLQKNKK